MNIPPSKKQYTDLMFTIITVWYKTQDVPKSNWILILKFILLHYFPNILQHQAKNGSVSSALHRSEKCSTRLGKDQRTRTLPLGIIHQLTTAIHKKGSESNSQFTQWQSFFFLIFINNNHDKYPPFFHIIRCMPPKKWFLPFFMCFYTIYIIIWVWFLFL